MRLIHHTPRRTISFVSEHHCLCVDSRLPSSRVLAIVATAVARAAEVAIALGAAEAIATAVGVEVGVGVATEIEGTAATRTVGATKMVRVGVG